MEERDGLAKRYGRSETEEAGEDLCLGRTTEPSDSAYWGFLNGVASDEGVMNAAAEPCYDAVWAGSMKPLHEVVLPLDMVCDFRGHR